jgi:hypothetical protein
MLKPYRLIRKTHKYSNGSWVYIEKTPIGEVNWHSGRVREETYKATDFQGKHKLFATQEEGVAWVVMQLQGFIEQIAEL